MRNSGKLTGRVATASLLAFLITASIAAAAGSTAVEPPRIVDLDGVEALVQRTSGGVLVVAAPSGIDLSPVADARGSSVLAMDDRSARVWLCPATSRPPSDAIGACLDAVAAGDPSAIAGFGRARANALADRDGAPVCPASIEVAARVRSPAGDLLDLDAAFTIVRSGKDGSCRVVEDRVGVGLDGGTADRGTPWPDLQRRAEGGDLDWDRWERLEPLLRLDEDEWALLEHLLFARDEDWAVVERDLRARASSAGSVDVGADVPAYESTGLAQTVDTILSRVNDLRTRMADLRTRVAGVRAVLGDDRPDIKALIHEVEVPKLRRMFEEIGDNLDGLLGTMDELRSGYESFAPGGNCDAGAACIAFRSDLRRVLDDIERGFETVQRLHCFDRPRLEIRQLDTSLMRRLLLEKTPALVLYAGSRFLDRIPDWSIRLGEVVDEIPIELTQFCEESNAKGLAALTRQDRCERILGVPEERFQRVKSVLGFSKAGLEVALPWIDEKKDVTIGLVALGGGTAGTSIKVPVKPVLEDVKALIEGIGVAVEARAAFRSSCAAERADERDRIDALELELRQCAPAVASVAGGIDASAALVQRRIDEMLDAGRDVRDAQTYHDDALAEPDPRDGFGLLCDAYAELVRPGSGKPQRPNPDRRSASGTTRAPRP